MVSVIFISIVLICLTCFSNLFLLIYHIISWSNCIGILIVCLVVLLLVVFVVLNSHFIVLIFHFHHDGSVEILVLKPLETFVVLGFRVVTM